MQKWIPGLLLSALILLAVPASAQIGEPSVSPGIQGEGPLTRARKALSDVDQMNQDSHKGTTSTPASPPKAVVKGPVGSTGVNSSHGKKPIISPLDKEALEAAKSGLENTYRDKVIEGANPMAVDASGSTALHLAAYKGHIGVVQFLAGSKGILIDPRDDAGNTPLQLAAAAGRDEVVVILLKAGANPKLKGAEGYTALHRAALRGFASTAEALVQNGADPLAQDDRGRTAAMLVEKAKPHNWEETAKILHDAEATAASAPPVSVKK